MKLIRAIAGAIALALISLAAPAHAQSALEWAVSQAANTNRVVSRGLRNVIDKRFARRILRAETRAGMLAGVSARLAAKAREIEAACGSVVISGVRPGARVAGSRRMSLHASGRAVDMRGNPVCIYAHLRGWPGGFSIDYGRVRHVHISLGGSEDGQRFTHRGRRHHHRYASR